MDRLDGRHEHLERQIGTLALSHVRSLSPMAIVRAAAWANAMRRVGVHLPLFLVHDLGLLLTAPRGPGGILLEPREPVLAALELSDETRALLAQYQGLLQALAASEVTERATAFRLRDDLVAVILLKILAPVYQRWSDPAKWIGSEELPLDPQVYAGADLIGRFRALDRAPLVGFLRFLSTHQLHVYTALEQLDLETLRLLGVFASSSLAAAPGVELNDLLQVFHPEASDVVSFSMELLPSVLESKRPSGVQRFAVDGYASLERRGSVDALVLSELAYDDELFERKVVDDELYYYGHDKQREQARRLQYLLVDSSPSMRGVRQVFARGLALTLAKKLSLQGDEVWLRFFDSRLYEVQRVSTQELQAPYLLCFRSERGRNYRKVFRQLQSELQRLRREEQRQVVLYVITHGQCHIPVELVQALRRDAYLYGVFILPSSDMALEYLPLLHRHQIVDREALASRSGRRARALEIVADADARRGSPGGTTP